MNFIKKVLCVFLTMLLSSSAITQVMASETVTMYALDGRTIQIPSSQIEAYQNVGWFTTPFVTMYAIDGRTIQIPSSQIEAYQNVGWYTSPVTIMYTTDERTAVVPKSDIAAWQKVGWYTSPVTTMYAPDGRTAYVGRNDVTAWKSVGWYDSPVHINKSSTSPDQKVSCYSGTNVPTYSSITGVYAESAEYNSYGYPCNLRNNNISKYTDYLKSVGFTLDEAAIEDFLNSMGNTYFRIVGCYQKGSSYVSIYFNSASGTLWIYPS